MVEQGVDIIDVGGESTRPGATTVSEQEEIDRVSTLMSAKRVQAYFDFIYIYIEEYSPRYYSRLWLFIFYDKEEYLMHKFQLNGRLYPWFKRFENTPTFLFQSILPNHQLQKKRSRLIISYHYFDICLCLCFPLKLNIILS